MTFTRQRSDGTHETNPFHTSNHDPRIHATLPEPGVEPKPLTSRLVASPLKRIATFAMTSATIIEHGKVFG